MKLINYKRGYNNTFACSIHGTIKMNREEFDNLVTFLYTDAIRSDHSYFNTQLLTEDLARRIFIKNSKGIVQGFLINVRVSATEALIKHFDIKGYKRGNYQIEVKTSVQTNYNYLVKQACGITTI